MTDTSMSRIVDTHMGLGLPEEGHEGHSGAAASIESIDPDAAIAEQMLSDQDQGTLDFHDQAAINKRNRHAQGGR
jgi:hypothetical protein